MSSEGEVVLLAVANAFLTTDYEYSLRIASHDFSYIANSYIFEGNILRYRALASFQLYEIAVADDDICVVDNFQLLAQAIESVENALEIYKRTG